jgi:hypothetical protein
MKNLLHKPTIPKALQLLTVAAPAVLVIALTGCVSHGYNKESATGANLRDSSSRITATQKKLDDTIGSLNELVNNTHPDLRPQYQKFSGNVDELASMARSVDEHVSAMASKGKVYFAQWDQQLGSIQNEGLRNRGETRETEVAGEFTNIERQYVETSMAFKPLMSDLRDVQKYLGTDLTQGGISSVKETVVKANAEASKVKESVSSLATKFNSLGVSLSWATVPPK